MGNILSGGTAGGLTLTVAYPLDLARTRLATDLGSGKKREFKGLWDCILKIGRNDGRRGLYRGYVVACCGVVSYRAWVFGLFDTGKTYLWNDYQSAPFLVYWLFA